MQTFLDKYVHAQIFRPHPPSFCGQGDGIPFLFIYFAKLSLGSSRSTSTKLLVVEYLDTGSYRKATTNGDQSIWAFFASALKLAYSDIAGRAYIIVREMQLKLFQCEALLLRTTVFSTTSALYRYRLWRSPL